MSEKVLNQLDPHITALRRQDKLKRMAKEKLRVVGGKVEKYTAEAPAQDIEKVVEEFIAAHKLEPGQMTKGRGIFLGTWSPEDENGNSLREVFNVFAAPEDLSAAGMTYEDTVKQVARLKNWHGHDGTNYKSDKELFRALKKGAYDGGWIIPPRDIADGYNLHHHKTMESGFIMHMGKGAFKDAFFKSSRAEDEINWYWTSTEVEIYIRAAYLSTGGSGVAQRDDHLSCRPVRLELKP